MNASIATKQARPIPATRERHVLCVDDDVDFLKSLEFFLPERVNAMGEEGLWYRFTFLDGPKKALETLCQLTQEGQLVAMLISDQMMPTMKGTEFLASARGLCEESIRVLLTGHAGIESAIGAINERLLDRYLTKPIDNQQEFVLSIRQLLEQYEMQFTIRDQRKLIHELYDFANTLNAKEDLQDTLEFVAKFAASALDCQEVAVVAGPQGAALSASSDWRGPLPRLRPAAARAEALERLGATRVGLAPALEEVPLLEPTEGRVPSGVVAFGILGGEKELLGVVVAHGPRRGTFEERDLQTLAYIVNTASIALHNQVHRVKLRVAWAETRAQATNLAAANQRLLILDRLKSDFLAFISHELRTPLNHLSAVGLLNVLEDPDEMKEAAHIVQRGYERFERFIAKALDYFSCLGADALKSSEATDLVVTVGDMVDELRATRESDLDLEVTLPDAACSVLVERTMAEEIVRILLDNAVKFSSEKPRVRVVLETEGSRVRLIVQDQGRGFPPQWSTELFQPFTIVESMHHHEGTALSLAKVAAIVGTHGGEIRAESPGLGRGATFIVELPQAAVDRASSGGSSGPDEGQDLSERAAA